MSDLYPDQVFDILTSVKMSRVNPCGGIEELRALGVDERDAETMVLAIKDLKKQDKPEDGE